MREGKRRTRAKEQEYSWWKIRRQKITGSKVVCSTNVWFGISSNEKSTEPKISAALTRYKCFFSQTFEFGGGRQSSGAPQCKDASTFSFPLHSLDPQGHAMVQGSHCSSNHQVSIGSEESNPSPLARIKSHDHSRLKMELGNVIFIAGDYVPS